MATLLIMLEQGMPIDDIIFADTGLEFPQVYDYLEKVEKYIGIEIRRLKHPTKDFESMFYQRKKRGLYVGQIYAFPFVRGCYIQKCFKTDLIKRYKREVGNHVSYLGITYDEPERYERLAKNQRSILYELKITQEDSLALVKKHGLLNPLYEYFDRGGCWLCPQQSMGDLRTLRRHFPGLWKRLMFYGREAEKYATSRRFSEFKPGWTVAELDERFALEDKQLTLFNKEVMKCNP